MTATITDRPAILGGKPIVTADHEAANRWPILGEEDEQAVLRVMRDGRISGHPVIRELEADYARLTGMPHALAHNNGTAGLLAAFHAIDLQPGDEVLVPTATFWATVLPMMWLGAVPVFCESEPERLGLDPADMERRITPRTRAIVVVHMFGLPSKMTEIRALAAKHDLRIIEDASHAHGAAWRGQPCGSLGDIAVFSMQGDKLVPAGEGGMFLCRDYEHFERAACLGDIARIIELETPARRFAATGLGVKTRISPLSAAVGRSQLARLEERNRRRNANLEYLSRRLEELGFHTFLPPKHVRRVYFEFIIRHERERIPLPTPQLVKALQAEGCHVGQPRYPMLHQQPFFTEGRFREIARLPEGIAVPKYRADELPQTLAGNETLIKLPTFPNADREILDQYADAFARICENAELILAGHKEGAA
ncbi:MAG: DegT/DnrJ/EryC1/StrS family aminotransferase [Alphaproteobacteria bacterium]|nr:DegT/DnrJ/EryC1/StrS family aminotransferase [Alphaproteobacteria bacterium]